MYEETIKKLKENGSIGDGDATIVCMNAVSMVAGIAFGAIGAAVAALKVSREPHHILAANTEEIRIFDIDRKTAEFLGNATVIKKEEIKSAAGGKRMSIKPQSGKKLVFQTHPKFNKYNQKEEYEKLQAILKTYKK
ncbi:MAG: hypothetical protein LBV13_02820 [Methanomassiliicoccaceae archaeon]|jgi:predicted acylesterase/phospholipase RssA|nr:hypothetical protein [Methanomassiliicoccaceae archaeon]